MTSTKILVAEDEEIMRITVVDHLRVYGWQVDEAENGNKALELIGQNNYQLLLSDIRMPGLDGEALLAEVKKLSPRTEVVMMTAHGSTDTAVNCLKNGAADYIQKPFDLDDLSFRIKRILEMQAIKARCVSLEHCGGQRRPLIGNSAPMQKVLNLISQVAGSDSSVLIQGESGTGKEIVAAAIHFESRRADKPYVRVNCAAIPDGLMESEFFGHEKGAFTGADKTSVGKFELADQGTILLDEIGDMPLDLQVKLLRVLQEKEIERVGGKQQIPINVRVLCSTAKNLAEEVKKGNFRQDLFYRLQVIPIELPALRDRPGDISLLADFFLQEFGQERGMMFKLSPEARQALENHSFPGNVRELRNLLERVSVLAPAPLIQLWDLPFELRGTQPEAASSEVPIAETLADAVADAEKKCILQALKKAGDNKTEAAAILGISRKNLWEKMKNYNL
ncbi:two-component system, NtrC family, response regulator AtoC [Malonomonas rubra DSM 5091]|uniref:Two-component system, NtrC family, response regulator AtoC n=1 Tax=Malonomonas rubra DSM 5091 TaxID=1122189 RepID=A0A1M6MZL2_MALRU|nr:sigma-54 dependent transcriptional regulator [Malonomonas rubra]SHJ88858.1 two-component system, NtrC family, response regulator AtoC [Malonomonas rubra DSM 5091]